MKRLFLIIVSALILSMQLSAIPAAAKDSVRKFKLPDHGFFEISVPASWDEKVDQPDGGYPPTITLTSKLKGGIMVIIKPLWSMTQKEGFNSAKRTRAILERDGRDMLPGAVERELAIKEVPRKEGHLFYFTLTNKDAKPGDNRCATRAELSTGGLLLSVAILTDSKDSKELKAALDALKGARQTFIK